MTAAVESAPPDGEDRSPDRDVISERDFLAAAAREAGLTVFPAVPTSDDSLSVMWPGHADEFVAVAVTVGASLLYLHVVALTDDAVDDVEEQLGAQDGSTGRSYADTVAAARRRVGKSFAVEAAFAHEGVLHWYQHEATWWRELQERAAAAVANQREVRSTARAQQRGEFDEVETRRDELIAGLATNRAFYCAANDDGRRL